MYLHANAKLGLAGRLALVRAIEEGMSLKAAAAAFSVSPATAHRWWHRWLEAGAEARRALSCLFDRSSRPRRSPRRLASELEQRICSCRRDTGWGPRLIAGATGFAPSTVWKVLRRAERVCPIVCVGVVFVLSGCRRFRALIVKVGDGGAVRDLACYVAIGVN